MGLFGGSSSSTSDSSNNLKISTDNDSLGFDDVSDGVQVVDHGGVALRNIQGPATAIRGGKYTTIHTSDGGAIAAGTELARSALELVANQVNGERAAGEAAQERVAGIARAAEGVADPHVWMKWIAVAGVATAGLLFLRGRRA